MKKTVFGFLFIVLLLTIMAFQCGGPPSPPPVGFEIHTMDDQTLFGTLEDSGGINVVMSLQEAIVSNPAGITDYFNGLTDDNGFYQAVNAIVPANWLFQENNGPCTGGRAVATVGNASLQDLDCIGGFLAVTVSPSTLYTSQPPSSLQVEATGFNTTYGMPHVQIWSSTGTKIADLVASSVTYNGTVLTSPPPNLTGVATGTYGLEVLNVQSNGSLSPVGAAPLPIIAPWAGWHGSGSAGWTGGGCYVPQPIQMGVGQQSNPLQWAVHVGGSPYAPGTSWSWTITDSQGTLLSGSATGAVGGGTYTASRSPSMVPSSTFLGTLNYPGCPTTMSFKNTLTLSPR